MRPLVLSVVALACAASLWLMLPDDRLLGRMYESEQRYADAIEALSRWSAEHPRDYATRWHTSELYLEVGSPTGALRTLHAMILDWPDDPKLRREAIRVHESRNDLRGTVSEYEALARILPDDVQTAHKLVDLHRFFQQDDRLLGALQRLVELEPKGYAQDELFGLLLFRGLYARAEAQLGPRIAAEPDDPALRSRLAELYLRMGRADDAIVQLRRAVALLPALDAPFDDLVNTLVTLGRADDAVDAWRGRVKVGGDPDLRRRFARFLLAHERWREGIGELRGAVRARPEDRALRIELVRALAGRARFTDALPHVERLAQDPEDMEAIALAARFHVWSGDSRGGLPWLRRWVSRAPGDAGARRMLADAAATAGRHREAARHFRWLARGDRRLWHIVAHHARRAGDRPGAIDALERAVAKR